MCYVLDKAGRDDTADWKYLRVQVEDVAATRLFSPLFVVLLSASRRSYSLGNCGSDWFPQDTVVMTGTFNQVLLCKPSCGHLWMVSNFD